MPVFLFASPKLFKCYRFHIDLNVMVLKVHGGSLTTHVLSRIFMSVHEDVCSLQFGFLFSAKASD